MSCAFLFKAEYAVIPGWLTPLSSQRIVIDCNLRFDRVSPEPFVRVRGDNSEEEPIDEYRKCFHQPRASSNQR